jgi:4-amino-4-deoxy-L-arabinose transferase-like glycosyltransferase
MSQAWSLVTQGRLSPYTYTYDHAPGGWLILGLWSLLTGGFHTFGFTINSGRVLMLVLNTLSLYFLYKITRRLTDSSTASLVALIVFSLSPLAIYYHRRVLLDNIMVFWTMATIYILLFAKPTWSVVVGAITFAFAVLTKETALFFLPGFIYLFLVTHSDSRYLRLVLWLLISGLIMLSYPLYALSRGQLFTSSLHPSLIGSVLFQLGRSGGAVTSATSDFQQVFRLWVHEDPFLIIFGFGSLLANLVLLLKNRLPLIPLIFVFPMLLFFLRGGVVFEFYLIPLIPFLALSMAIFYDMLAHTWKAAHYLPGVIFAVFTFGLIFFGSRMRGGFNLFTANQTLSQSQAVNWFLSQSHPAAFIATDQSLYLDLVTRNRGNFQDVYYYWKIEPDPTLKATKLSNNPQNVSLLAVTPQMENDIRNAKMYFLGSALASAHQLQRFENDGWRVLIYSNIPP